MTTTKYDLHTIEYSTQGWDSVMNTDMQKLDDVIQSRITATLGETVVAYNALYLNADGKFYKALANGSSQPALGLAVEGGDLDDVIRLHVFGETTSSGWAWATKGAKLYLSASISGALTDVEPVSNIQAVGYALTATKIIFSPSFEEIGDYATTASLATTSGTLQDQIDGIVIPTDFYSRGEVDTISGTLNTKIDTTSGTLQDQIDNLPSVITTHSGLSDLAYADAGHTGFQPSGDYATNSDLTITSGTLQDQIDALPAVITTHSGLSDLAYADAGHTGFQEAGSYATTVDLDTVSGTLHDEINSETKLFGVDNWRITVSGTDLLFQQFVTDEWITQTTISGS